MDIYHQQHEERQGSSSILPSPVPTPPPEFSFTTTPLNSNSFNLVPDSNKTKTPSSSSSSSIAVDLCPADDIIFHGHLLPLHLITQLPVSPRSSTNSIENFIVPKTDDPATSKSHTIEAKVKNKSKTFSLFGFKKQQPGEKEKEKEKEKGNQQKNKKTRFEIDMSGVLKRYTRMIRPLLFFRGKREKLHHIHSYRQQAYSFTGNLSLRNKNTWFRGKKTGYYSAPSSTGTSPKNSGLLVSSKSDSTMEELQAAIQSAIAHCKNSIKGEDELK